MRIVEMVRSELRNLGNPYLLGQDDRRRLVNVVKRARKQNENLQSALAKEMNRLKIR